ncbi:MAG: autotransporter-associated beta strand repeat-containing protein, partial [Alphaproteobacteria bacterium]|nr:autotransporter-associated beta strand repeat-containing protein [Alphaproteobacteria bacterium]
MYRAYRYRRSLKRALLLSTAVLLASPAFAGTFVNAGPGPILDLGYSGQQYDNYIGAISSIVTDPANANTLYVGAVNGGVWVTHDGGTSWTPLTDTQASLSIDTLVADPTDATHQTLLAGTGLVSNGQALGYTASGGPRDGLLYSTNGGTSWTQLGATTFANQSVDALAVRGSTILAGTFEAASSGADLNNGALYLSTDGGKTFTDISGTSGLPNGPVSSIAGDPSNNAVLYAAITAPNGASNNSTAIYVSSNTGASWTQIFSSANAGGVISAGHQTQIRLAAGPGGSVAAAVEDLSTGKLVGVFLSKNSGTSWQSLPVPNVNTGGQGNVNLAIAIDPSNANYVYVTGDTISSSPYTVTAYRIDAGANSYTSITGANTADGSSVHADSRAIAFGTNGQLLLSTDGGLYSRSQPQSSTGTWSSLNGNLAITEAYQAVYGANAHLVAVAAQDNGASLQKTTGATTFSDQTSGDGIDAAVNDKTLSGKSAYYLSAQNLGLNRVVVDSSGTILANQQVTFTGAPTWPTRTLLTLNNVDPTLIAIGGNDVYLSQDTLTGADAPGGGGLTLSLTKLGGGGGGVSAMAYGAADNTNALIAGIGGGIWMSTSTAGGINTLPAYAGQSPSSLVFDPRTQNRFYAADTASLWGTTNQGASFQDLTANLPSGLFQPTALEFINSNGVDALLVGGLDNAAGLQSTIAVADSSATGVLSNWRFFGNSLPNVPVYSLSYNPLVDVLTVATFGRGAWLLYDVTSNFSQATVLQFGLANNDSTPDTSLLTGARPLIKYGSGTLLITGAGTYTGGSTINAGTLQLGNGGTGGSIIGDLVDNGQFTINRSDSYTFGGVISGTGAFTQA